MAEMIRKTNLRKARKVGCGRDVCTSNRQVPVPGSRFRCHQLESYRLRMSDHPRTELVLEALDRATQPLNSEETIHHSDQGSRYAFIALGSVLRGRWSASLNGLDRRLPRDNAM